MAALFVVQPQGVRHQAGYSATTLGECGFHEAERVVLATVGECLQLIHYNLLALFIEAAPTQEGEKLLHCQVRVFRLIQ